MPALIAELTGSGSVRLRGCPAILMSMKMLAGTLEIPRLAKRNNVLLSELFWVVRPHQQFAIQAAAGLVAESLGAWMYAHAKMDEECSPTPLISMKENIALFKLNKYSQLNIQPLAFGRLSMNKIVLSDADKSGFERALALCKTWSINHQAEVGVAEMALGAAVLSWGVMNGHLVMGQDVVASKLADIGGLAGLGIGSAGSAAVAATILKGVFVGGVGFVAGVTSIPALALIGGGALILGSFGYVIGDKLDPIFNPPAGFGDLLLGASIVAVGTALLIDGARRIVKDERVLATVSKFKDGMIQLVPQATEIVAANYDELQILVKELAKSPSAYATAGTSVIAGATIGSTLAAGTVSVLGSQGLGAVALSLGLVSAPVWPVVAGGAAGLALGAAAWKGIKHYRSRQNGNEKDEAKVALLPSAEKN